MLVTVGKNLYPSSERIHLNSEHESNFHNFKWNCQSFSSSCFSNNYLPQDKTIVTVMISCRVEYFRFSNGGRHKTLEV